MLNKLRRFIRSYQLVTPGDHIVCAVSGGADSVALLFAMYLLRESMEFKLSAAHFNHCLRGDESDRDEAFVRALCDRLEIPLYVGKNKVVAGKKGLESAARDARYAFLETLDGKIATAHTADDNAETVLMHMVRGTGLKGLGGIAPKNGLLIRPMLTVTRDDVLAFLQEYNLSYVTDSSNDTDLFMRNRMRHHVMPLLRQENPKLAENMSAMALRLREDEMMLEELSAVDTDASVQDLRQMPKALRCRYITRFLQSFGIKEPEAAHIALVDNLVFSESPSARIVLANGVHIFRCYDQLTGGVAEPGITPIELTCPDENTLDYLNLQIRCTPAGSLVNEPGAFSVLPVGRVVLRCRQAGDTMRLPGGTKTLKKIFIDRKIPKMERGRIPVIADDEGILGVYGIGANLDRLSTETGAVEYRFNHI